MHVVTGLGERESFRPDDFLAYYRRLRARFLDAVERRRDDLPVPGRPLRALRLPRLCKRALGRGRPPDARRRHLAAPGRAAHRRRDHDARGARRGRPRTPSVTSMRAGHLRGAQPPGRAPAPPPAHGRAPRSTTSPRSPSAASRSCRSRARATSGSTSRATRGSSRRAGSSTCSAGSSSTRTASRATSTSGRATATGEKAAFERLVDHVVERRRRFPGMHVYHYAPYERTALCGLMGEHGTREDEIDDLLRGEVLVDLFRVTKQALRASVPSYSIKEVEKLYGFERTADVGGGSESVIDFEAWLETRGGRAARRRSATTTRRTASRSTSCTAGCSSSGPADLAWRLPPDQREPSEEARGAARRARARPRRAARRRGGGRAALAPRAPARVPPARGEAAVVGVLPPPRARRGGAARRRRHDRRARARRRARAGQAVARVHVLVPGRRSTRSAARAVDPATEREYRRRGRRRARHGHAAARDQARRRAAAARADPAAAAPDLGPARRRPALRAATATRSRRSSRSSSAGRPRARLDGTPVEAALSLDGSYLFVQGPPGSGKTWNGARMAVALMRAGRRVGVTALSHKAIHKFLEEVEDAARRGGLRLPRAEEGERGGVGASRASSSRPRGTNAAMLDPEVQLLAGTSFLFAREELVGAVDTLFVDEGGQFALADALAVGGAARNLVLLGDPNQLPQVSQGAHPPGANASVLGHLLGEDETVRPDMGLFLEQTWRLRPEVNALHLGDVLRGAARAGAEGADALGRGRERRPLPPGRARRATARPRRRRRRRCGPRSSGCSGRRTPTRTARGRSATRTSSSSRRTTRTCAACASALPEARPGRHGGQVPGPGGDGRLLLDGELERARTSRAGSTSSSRATA